MTVSDSFCQSAGSPQTFKSPWCPPGIFSCSIGINCLLGPIMMGRKFAITGAAFSRSSQNGRYLRSRWQFSGRCKLAAMKTTQLELAK